MEPLPNFSRRLILTVSRRLKTTVPYLALLMIVGKKILYFMMYIDRARYGTAKDQISEIRIYRLS